MDTDAVRDKVDMVSVEEPLSSRCKHNLKQKTYENNESLLTHCVDHSMMGIVTNNRGTS